MKLLMIGWLVLAVCPLAQAELVFVSGPAESGHSWANWIGVFDPARTATLTFDFVGAKLVPGNEGSGFSPRAMTYFTGTLADTSWGQTYYGGDGTAEDGRSVVAGAGPAAAPRADGDFWIQPWFEGDREHDDGVKFDLYLFNDGVRVAAARFTFHYVGGPFGGGGYWEPSSDFDPDVEFASCLPVPIPGTLTLGVLGLGLVRWGRRSLA